MNTKKVKHIILSFAVGCGLTATTSSCNDFLEIMPMNDVVLENYWTEKTDVESVVASCYNALAQKDCLNRLALWGELRSDNMTIGNNPGQDERAILRENILQTNVYNNWSKIYEVINRCNTVCYYAPQVQQEDPNYSYDEMLAHVAEARTLRNLCYFYLIRTFRDVPYVTRPSIDDTEQFIVPAMKFDEVLDNLISDLEEIKDDAVRRYRLDDASDSYLNSSRITRVAVYALLADLNLWKGNWDEVIRYCDLVLDFKRNQYKEMMELQPTRVDIELYDDIPMLVENPSGITTYGSAYNAIFGEGNSFESLFELRFGSSTDPKNDWVASFYGNSSNRNGKLHVPDFLALFGDDNKVFTKTDCRLYESIRYDAGGNRYNISKYAYDRTSFQTKNLQKRDDLKQTSSVRDDDYSPWIFYRLSDVLLMKAEALIERNTEDAPAETGDDADNGNDGQVNNDPTGNDPAEPQVNTRQADFEEAFKLIDIVSRRAHGQPMTASHSDLLKKDNFIGSKAAMESLVMDERHREFLFEGKRWFDLVRIARRDAKNDYLIEQVAQKYKEERNTIKIKLADPNIIYFPYAKSELKVNPLLKQNPAFLKGEDSELSK